MKMDLIAAKMTNLEQWANLVGPVSGHGSPSLQPETSYEGYEEEKYDPVDDFSLEQSLGMLDDIAADPIVGVPEEPVAAEEKVE